MNRGLKVCIVAGGGIITLIILTLASLCFYVQTPAGSAFLLRHLQDLVKTKANATLTFTRASINPFSHLHFENLNLVQEDASGRLAVQIPLVDITYSFSIFARSVTVETFQIDRPKIEFLKAATLIADPVTKPASAEAPAKSPAQIAALISRPTVNLIVKKLSVHEMNINFREKDLSAQLENLSLDFSLEWNSKRLASIGNFQIGDASHLHYSMLTPGVNGAPPQTLELSAFPFADAKWDANLTIQDSKWIYGGLPTAFHFGLKALTILETQGKTTLRTYSPLQQASLNVDLSQDIEVRMNYSIRQLTSPPTTLKPLQIELNSLAHLSRDLKSFQAQGAGTLNQLSLLDFNLQGQSIKDYKIDGKINLRIDPQLARWLRPAAQLKQTGFLRNQLGIQASLGDLSTDAPIHASLALDTVQEQKKGAAATFDPLHLEAKIDGPPHSLKVTLQGEVPNLRTPSLKRAYSVHLDSNLSYAEKNHIKSGNTDIKIQVQSDSKWESETQLKFEVTPAASPQQSLVEGGVVHLDGSTSLREASGVTPRANPVAFLSPLVISHKMDLDHGKTQVNLVFKAPELEVARVGQIHDTEASLQLKTELPTAKNLDFALDLRQGKILLEKGATIEGLNGKVRADITGENAFTLREVSAEFNHSMMTLFAQASGDIKAKNFQTQGSLFISVPENFPAIAGQSIYGRVQFPWTIAIYKGRQINFDGNMSIFNLGWAKASSKESPAALRVDGISGKIPVSEQLLWDGKEIKFAHLITQNPFERVDFDRLQPMIYESDTLDIKSIGFEEKRYGPFQGYFAIKQNMIFAHKFDLSLGSGRTFGEMYFDTYPANLQMGFLARMTGLKLPEILPTAYLQKIPKGDEKMSGRTGVVVNLNSGSIDGRLDITEISGSQLITLINTLDPKYENEQLNRARTALGLAYPTFVQMAFQDGYMNMDVKLEIAGAFSQDIILRGISISPWISGTTAGIVRKVQEGPLK